MTDKKCGTCNGTGVIVQACPSCHEEPLRIEPLAVVKKWVMVQVGKENVVDMCLRDSRCWNAPPANNPDVWLPSYAFVPVRFLIL